MFHYSVGMMAMFSVQFVYKIASMFKFRLNNDGKTYADDLLSSTVDRVEYCLVKHMLFLLDNFGLFPTLRDNLNTENALVREVLYRYHHQESICPGSLQYSHQYRLLQRTMSPRSREQVVRDSTHLIQVCAQIECPCYQKNLSCK